MPEASALGLSLTQRSERNAARGDLAPVGDVERVGTESSGGNGYGYDFSYCGAKEGIVQCGQDALGGGGKERAVPTMLARRPHEIDNSSLQVRCGVTSFKNTKLISESARGRRFNGHCCLHRVAVL